MDLACEWIVAAASQQMILLCKREKQRDEMRKQDGDAKILGT